MTPALTYTEQNPPRDLAPWVACFWRIAGSGGDSARGPFCHRVLPDGCADLLFDLEGLRRSGGSAPDLIGPMSVAHVVELSGTIDVLGVRLRPGAIAAFGGIPANELLDTAVPFSLAVTSGQLADSECFSARLQLVTAALRARVAALGAPDPAIRHALGRWAGAERPDFPTISVLTRDLGLSERAFERRFVANVGLTPVGYRRLARLRCVLRLYAEGTRGWASIAADTGFSDQSHLVRDCRALTGLTPTEWAATQVGGAGFLQDGYVTTV